ncbi:MAG: hypothetical protein J6A19_14615 [Oscillospiraceae bacterium]|nr:hypothetical protein [Oscillospiraceae bacterium]
MPTVEEHEKKFQHNRNLVSYLRNTEYQDWQITACFYAALHIVQSCLHSEKHILDDNLLSHKDTQLIIRKNFPEVLCDYTSLLELSYTSRYQSLNDILSVDLNDAETHLQNIIDECESLRKHRQKAIIK